MVKSGGGINLAQGLPGFRPPEMLLEYLEKFARSQYHQYAPGLGVQQLREQAALACHSAAITSENIMITNGGTEAISLIYTYLFKKLKAKLHVMAIAPVYESYRELPAIFGNDFHLYQSAGTGSFETEDFLNQVKSKNINLVFLASPGNPLGKVFSRDEIETICHYCRQNHVYIVIDLVYKYLYYNNKPYIPYHLLSDYILFADSWSKQFSISGWRLGYVVAPAVAIHEMSAVHDFTGLSSPMPLQQSLAAWLGHTCEAESYLDEIRVQVKNNFRKTGSLLQEAGYTCLDADGGIFLCAALPQGFGDGFDFAMSLYEAEKLAVVPGIHFDDRWSSVIRLNIAYPEEIIHESVQRLLRFTQTYMKQA